ncbi:HSP70/90 co-chaperone, partial [Coemansia asiatica]
MAEQKSTSVAASSEPLGPEPSPMSHAENLDSLVQKLRSTPLFMTDLSDAGDDNMAVEALKSLSYDDPPEETATNLKDSGNEQFKAGNFAEAVKFYSRALDHDGHDNKALKVSLLTNRAAANLELKNFGRAIQDCADALRIRPETPKALFRSAKAFLALEKFDEARECCKWALELDPQGSEIKRLQKLIEDTQVTFDRRIREREEREKARQRSRELLKRAVEIREGLCFDTTAAKKKDLYAWENDSARQVVLDESSGHLQWPVFFLYPESKESDFVE